MYLSVVRREQFCLVYILLIYFIIFLTWFLSIDNQHIVKIKNYSAEFNEHEGTRPVFFLYLLRW